MSGKRHECTPPFFLKSHLFVYSALRVQREVRGQPLGVGSLVLRGSSSHGAQQPWSQPSHPQSHLPGPQLLPWSLCLPGFQFLKTPLILKSRTTQIRSRSRHFTACQLQTEKKGNPLTAEHGLCRLKSIWSTLISAFSAIGLNIRKGKQTGRAETECLIAILIHPSSFPVWSNFPANSFAD